MVFRILLRRKLLDNFPVLKREDSVGVEWFDYFANRNLGAVSFVMGSKIMV